MFSDPILAVARLPARLSDGPKHTPRNMMLIRSY